MTLVEFIAPLKKKSHRDRVLAILYFKYRYENESALTVERVRSALKSARATQWAKANVADVLSKCGHYVDTPGTEGNRRLWSITTSGQKYVRGMLDLPENEPEIEHDVSALSTIVKNIKDAEIRDYVEESIKCLRAGALRASVVFLWAGAIRKIQNDLLTFGSKALNPAIQKHDPKARNITKLDQFAYVKDKVVILAALELGLIDKHQKDVIEEGLNLRNRCGHPGRYKPGPKKVSSFIEDIVSIVLS